jgi:AraC-like DNA-binding protein
MKWSLSEFLNLIELRSQSWCFVDLGPSSGFSIPHNEAIFLYAMLEGSASIAGVTGGGIELHPGDIVMILSGEAHALRNQEESPAAIFDFLSNGEYVDAPPAFAIGEGQTISRLLCSRLKVRWPGGARPRAIPSLLEVRSGAGIVNFQSLAGAARGSGASSILTRLATLLFVHAFRDHPQCQSIFRQFNVHDPILRARQFIEKHPFQHWTVEILAGKVGMGRSNFATRFAHEIGKTPMEVLTEERMKHAANFLENTDLKVAEVSERVGYRSEAAFNRRFTSFFGVTPGQLCRQKHQMEKAQCQSLPVVLPYVNR